MEGSPRGILQLVDCVAKSACFGIGEQGFRKTVEACVESERVKSSSVLEYFFRVAPTKKDSVAAQVFASPLKWVLPTVLHNLTFESNIFLELSSGCTRLLKKCFPTCRIFPSQLLC